MVRWMWNAYMGPLGFGFPDPDEKKPDERPRPGRRGEEEMMLPNAVSRYDCPKCGYRRNTLKYLGANDRVRVTCLVCGYFWEVEPREKRGE